MILRVLLLQSSSVSTAQVTVSTLPTWMTTQAAVTPAVLVLEVVAIKKPKKKKKKI